MVPSGGSVRRRLRCWRLRALTPGSVTTALTRPSPSQRGPRRLSIANTRCNRARPFSGALGGPSIFAGLGAGLGAGRDDEAARGCMGRPEAGVPHRMRSRTWPLGRGTRAARGAIKFSGSNSPWGVPSLKGRFNSSPPRPSPWTLKRCPARGPRAMYRPTRSSVARSFGSPATARLSEQPARAAVKGLASAALDWPASQG